MIAVKISENNIRSRLWKRGYHLTKVSKHEFYVSDSNRIVCYGSDIAPVSLEEITDWINQL